MNRRLPCSCHWIAGRGYLCPEADALQRGIQAAEETGNAILVTMGQRALVTHWRANGLTQREFDVLTRRSDALLRRDGGD